MFFVFQAEEVTKRQKNDHQNNDGDKSFDDKENDTILMQSNNSSQGRQTKPA